jgi:predicted transcriptional regulator of viral defense system
MQTPYTSRPKQAGLGSAERRVLAALAATERPIITSDDLIRVSGLDRQAANLMLSRLSRKGWLRRLRRGVYETVPLSSSPADATGADPLAMAMELFSPCFISGWTAAQHWDLTEQIFNSVAVYSARPQRQSELQIGDVHYRIRRVTGDAIFGTTNIWSGTVAVKMATAHRTVIDVLDAPEMGGGGRQTLDIVRAYWNRADRSPGELLQLATRLGAGSVFKRLGFTAERFGKPERSWLDECRTHLTSGIALLDPGSPPQGPIISRWRLRINIPVDEKQ